MPTRREALEAFLAADPDDSFTRYALALEYASAGETARAITCLNDTIARDPHYVPAYHQLGRLYADAGREADAADAYTRGIAEARLQKDNHAASEMTQELESLSEDRS